MHIIRKKQGDKAAVLPVRPPAPSLEEMQNDIQNASDDDYVFQSGGQNIDENDLNIESNLYELNPDGDAEKPDLKTIAKVEQQYNKVVEFVKLYNNLVDGQKELNESSQGLSETCVKVQAEKTILQTKLQEQEKLYQSKCGA